ncbi:hypothetical protein E4U19_002247 [Claviceps sp. Clav32 group G5]|nr:hypothetical protein E4U19_002247 [Claviceps sp. Clav32 group G5]
MGEDSPVASFGDPSDRPPTPTQTPTSTALSSPIFETPNPYLDSVSEPGGLTPRFAEEYSVFNDTPGNLRGTRDTFPEFDPASCSTTSSLGYKRGHKRILSAESFDVEITAHVDQSSSNLSAPLSPVDSARPFSVSSASSVIQQSVRTKRTRRSQLSCDLTQASRSSKRARRGSITETEIRQTISPPPTARKGVPTLAPKPSMQIDAGFGRADPVDSLQQDITAFMDNIGDTLGYPMSAPAITQPNFWDLSTSMGADAGGTTSGNKLFQSSTSHRHTGSFDWNAESQLFQDPSVRPSSNRENARPSGGLRPSFSFSTSKSSSLYTNMNRHSVPATHPPITMVMDDSCGVTNASDVVEPGLLFNRPWSQCADIHTGFGGPLQSGSAEAAIVRSGKSQTPGVYRSNSCQEVRNRYNGPDRATASSPIRALGRPGFGRSASDSRANTVARRGSLPLLDSVMARPASDLGLPIGSKSTARRGGRTSPFKRQSRLTSLASIPETSPQTRPRTYVRLLVDDRGRARTVTTVDGDRTPTAPRTRSSQERAQGRGYCSSVENDDSDDTDDEPIIIPSRHSSFNTSFPLPGPRKSPGSSVHWPTRSMIEHMNNDVVNDPESEAETVVYDKPDNVGNAMSELRRVVEDRKRRALRFGTSGFQKSLPGTKLGGFPGGIISPTSLTESSYGPESYGVRCVCNNNKMDGRRSYMVQCDSCEMWLHGQCISTGRRTIPSTYICVFCASTPQGPRRQIRVLERDNALGIGTVVSPLANKSLRCFR